MLELKSFPSSFASVSFSKKKKRKKKILLKPRNVRNLFFLDRKPATSIPTISHFSPLPSATECQSTFLKVGLQLFGESRGEGGVGKRKIHVCFLDSNWQDGGDRLEKFSFETRLSFSLPISAPHLFIVVDLSRHSTPLLFPPGSTTWFEKIELVSNWISYSVSWRVFLIISIRWKCLLGRGDVSKRVHSTTRRSIIPSRGGSTVRLFLF